MRQITPREAVDSVVHDPQLADGPDERFTGFGVMGVPFATGHYLALRAMLASSIGPPYRAIWHRTPEGRWRIFTTTAAEVSCPRYFGRAAGATQVEAVDLDWTNDRTLLVRMGQRVSWQLTLEDSPSTRVMSTMGGLMPGATWDSDLMLGGMGPMAGVVLGAGRIRLRGRTPNGPWFRAAPLQVWRVISGRATIDGVDLGPVGALEEQCHLGDFWMPNRGLFFVGRASFSKVEAVDPVGGERA